MQNWEVVKKKISEIKKDDFINIVKHISCLSIGELLSITIKCSKGGCIKCKERFMEEEYQPPKQEKWIVHRTLRTKGIEVYVCERKFANYSVISVPKEMTYFTSHIKDNAIEFKDLHSATFVRDKLNETRKGKQYLWVVSKVEG